MVSITINFPNEDTKDIIVDYLMNYMDWSYSVIEEESLEIAETGKDEYTFEVVETEDEDDICLECGWTLDDGVCENENCEESPYYDDEEEIDIEDEEEDED